MGKLRVDLFCDEEDCSFQERIFQDCFTLKMIEAIALSISFVVLTISCLASSVSFVQALFKFA